MTLSDGVILNVPAARAWELLHDPAVLAAAIPGCDGLEVTGPGAGRFTVTPALAAISGTYSGEYLVTEETAPVRVTLTASGTSDRGAFTIDLTVRLTETDGLAAAGGDTVLVRYEVASVFSGGIAGTGQRLLASITSRLATEFFAALDRAAAPPVTAGATGAVGVARALGVVEAAGADLAGVPDVADVSPEKPRRTVVPPARFRVTESEEDGGAGWAGLTNRTDVRIAFAAGVAIGLAGVIVAAVLGRQSRFASRGRLGGRGGRGRR